MLVQYWVDIKGRDPLCTGPSVKVFRKGMGVRSVSRINKCMGSIQNTFGLHNL